MKITDFKPGDKFPYNGNIWIVSDDNCFAFCTSNLKVKNFININLNTCEIKNVKEKQDFIYYGDKYTLINSIFLQKSDGYYAYSHTAKSIHLFSFDDTPVELV